MKQVSLISIALISLPFSLAAQSLENPQQTTATESVVAAEVNGIPIMESTVQMVVDQLEGTGEIVDRSDIVRELATSEALSQLAVQLELHKESDIASLLQLQRNSILAKSYLSRLSESIVVTDDEIEAAYNAYKKESTNWEYHAAHILLDTRKQANLVIEKLSKELDFAVAAQSYSKGPSKHKGGDLGWFSASEMDPAFARATSELVVGQHSKEAVESAFGWHVILLRGKRLGNILELSDMRATIIDDISSTKQNILIENALKNVKFEIN